MAGADTPKPGCETSFHLPQKFRVLAIDYLGHGYTDKPKITYGLNAFSKHLLDFMDAAGVEKAPPGGVSCLGRETDCNP
jgi:pimeloyl-ACP methyl ester carboxylesterase